MPDWMDLPLPALCNHKTLLALHLDLGETSPVVPNNVVRSLRAIWNIVSEDPWPGRKIQLFRDKRRETIVEDFAHWERSRRSFANPHIRALWLFALLTGLRRYDAQTARYDNLKDGWLHLPSPKGGERRAFDLPLSTQAMELIAGLPHLSPWIFPGRDAKKPITHPMPDLMPTSMHDLRRTYATHAELIGCPRGVLARLLNRRPDRSITAQYVIATDEACQEWAQRIADRINELLVH